MKAKDIMTTQVISVAPEVTVREIASQLLTARISAVPVVDADGRLVGIVSEGDLLHRVEAGTAERPRPWWLNILADPEGLAAEYVKSHGRRARDVMTANVVSVTEETPVAEIAELLETRRIKRVPVLRDGKPVGIVSRANLLHALVAIRSAATASPPSDEAIRTRILDELQREPWGRSATTNVIVADGVVEFWGIVGTEAEKRASRTLAENVPGVKAVIDRRTVAPVTMGAY
jgi:CBS domain-containing protein